jgi:hypothetical protein
MRKAVGPAMVAVVAALLLTVAPVAAAPRASVHMEVQTNFDPADDPFTATGIPNCASGTVGNGANIVQFVRTFGVFAGDKVFDCGGESGFVVRLNATFSYSGGSIGSWSIVHSWGAVAGLQGSGKLVGTPTGDDSILDVYDGTVN